MIHFMRKCFSISDCAVIPESVLPPTMREIASEIGVAAALALADLHGGHRLRVPVNADDRKTFASLADAMGKVAAVKFIRIYGGGNVDIPKCVGARRALRDAEIRRAAAGGDSYSTLARRFDLTERRIGSILSSGRQRDNKAGAHR